MTPGQAIFILFALALLYAWTRLYDDGGDHWF